MSKKRGRETGMELGGGFEGIMRGLTDFVDKLGELAEKGERLFAVLLERLVALCREYHEIDPPRYREFGSHCP